MFLRAGAAARPSSVDGLVIAAALRKDVFRRQRTGRFGWQALRAALDSSPLLGAGRVEDTWNLIGHARRTVATCAAKDVAAAAGAGLARGWRHRCWARQV